LQERSFYTWLNYSLLGVLVLTFLAGITPRSEAGEARAPMTSMESQEVASADSVPLRYPIQDYRGDGYTNEPRPSIDLNDPRNVKRTVEYDPLTGRYKITERIGDQFLRAPTWMTFEEFMRYEQDKQVRDYFEKRSKIMDYAERKSQQPDLYSGPELFNRLFGGTKIEIKPQGNVEMTMAVNSQRIDNPVLLESQRKQTNFDFDMNIQLNMTGQIGDKLKLATDFNTKAVFDFENQIKLGYTGKEDQIIKSLEAGNVSLPLRGTLIRGNQSLFGLKTQFQFGRLTMTNVLSQQKSQAQNIRIEGGAQTRKFDIKADEYEENKHYFITQYFRDTYEQNLRRMPIVTSQVVINRAEVWVTNKTRQTEGVREVVALMDLGEKEKVSNPTWMNPAGETLPSNQSNLLYATLTNPANNPKLRDPITVINLLEQDLNMRPVDEFEKTSARLLAPTEYTLHPQLGYISLNQTMRSDEILGIAIEYTVNGRLFKVGEFSTDVPPSTDTTNIKDKVLVLKMLKSTSVRTLLPIWDLMMKNVYTLNAFQVNSEDFMLDVYYRDPGGGDKRYLPDGGDITGQQLIKVLRLDQLNNQLDPQPDGRFDFIPGITINPQNGRIYFPVLEPFGEYLRRVINNNNIADRYVYDLLYDSTKVTAQQSPEFNRFLLKGQYKSSVSSEIQLGAFNIPQGSVTVSAAGQILQENVHYTVEYGLGRVRIIDEGIINSGVPIDVKFENNLLFGIQTKSLIGTRLDYWVNKNLSLGFTHMRLSEKPFTQKVNIGDDPIKNNIMGLDLNYATESKRLTKIFNAITQQDTDAPSRINASAEAAYFKPGHAKGIQFEDQGTVYLDDFEGASVSYDYKYPYTSWVLASTPKGMPGMFGGEKFPEARRFNDLSYGFNRAKLSWYQIDNLFYSQNDRNPLRNNRDEREGIYTRLYYERQLFPNRENPNLQNAALYTFDMYFDPTEKGPYNFETTGEPGISAGIDANGKLNDPGSRWGGVMRSIETNDFEAANIEFIQLWVLDPFLNTFGPREGNLYIHLGAVSEDILRDGRKQYENGLPRPGGLTRVDTSVWGVTPSISNAITNAFDSDPEVVRKQDVGLDGLDDDDERVFFENYLTALQGILSPEEYQRFLDDPSKDNFVYPTNDAFSPDDGILARYRNFNGPQANSSNNINSTTNGNFKAEPDNEDLNRDNTLNETEEFFQYRIDFSPEGLANSKFVTDRVVVPVSVNGVPDTAVWYQIKIPVEEFESRVGNIPDFRSVRYMRMVMSDFKQPVVLRFAEIGLVRNQWRKYTKSIGDPRETLPGDNDFGTEFTITPVSVEENTGRFPIPYAIPPGIEREQNISGYNNTFQNEQSLSLQVCELADGDARAMYKITDLDLRNFKRLRMFTHAENLNTNRGMMLPINDNDISVFIRLGADFTENYYEYELPLKVTPAGQYNPNSDADRLKIWPAENNLDISLDSLPLIKQLRNNQGFPLQQPFVYDMGEGKRVTVRGNPDIGQAAVLMIGVRNPKRIVGDTILTDDGMPKCAEVWVNELRLSGFDEQGGWAALGRVDMQLGNLGSLTVSGNMHTIGFGDLEQKLDQRYRDNYYQFDIAANLDLGKLIPEKAGLQIPVYANYFRGVSTPQYDPYELDIKLEDKFRTIDADPTLTRAEKDALKDETKQVAQTVTSIKSVNVTNMRKIRTNSEKPIRAYDIENWNFTYAFTQKELESPVVEYETITRHRGALGYNYSTRPKYWEPLKKIRNNNKWLRPIKEFNLNPYPGTLAFNTELDRQFGETKIRDIGNDGLVIDPTFDKFFTWNRFFNYKHDLSRSINFDYTTTTRARIDEPAGRIDTKEKKDSVLENFWRFGRSVGFEQAFNANYTFPFRSIPLLDWLNGKVRYGSTFGWTAASLVIPEWGNIVSNSQTWQITGEANMRTLYNKAAFLKPYAGATKKLTKTEYAATVERANTQKNNLAERITAREAAMEKKKDEIEQAKQDTATTRDQMKILVRQRKDIKNDVRKLKSDKRAVTTGANPAIDILMQPLTMLQRVSVSYDQKRATTLPGFMPVPKFFGQDFNYNAPGGDFILGAQKDSNWLSGAAAKGWISEDTTLNLQFQQSKSENLQVRFVVQPFRDLRVDINLNKQNTQIYTEYFKKTGADVPFRHLSPQVDGSYSISFISFRTIFQKIDQNNFSNAFREFEALRQEYSQQLGALNPNSVGIFQNDSISLPNFMEGYGPYSPDVLIPAFLAAYTGKDPNKVKLNPLRTIPLPNWRITYNGFTKMKWGQKLFNNFNITHAYQNTFSISSYSSDLNFLGSPGFDGEDVYFVPSALDTLSGNFYNLYNIPQVTISEQFAPLIGVSINWKMKLITDFQFKKARTLGFNFLDFQLSETRSTEMTAGLGYSLANFKLPFKIRGKSITLDNDINFKVDFSFRSDRSVNLKLDQNIAEPTRGAKTISLSPTIDYVINQRMNFRIFYDYRKTVPATFASYPQRTSRGGITFRFNLAP
jgi:cell surface protein SprA